MTSECNFPDHDNTHLDLDKEDESDEDQRSSIPDTVTSLARNDSNFNCNNCLEFVQDPVVSLCGHLYCWPCIYQWIHVSSVPNEDSDHRPQCPVCKAEVSVAALVPLYGRGTDMISYEQEAPNHGLTTPHRPSAPMFQEMSPMSFCHHQQIPELYHAHSSPSSVLSLGGTSFFQSIIEMLSSRPSIIRGYDNPNSYNTTATLTPRVRRQLMRVDQSFSRLCFFFFCCMVLCLLLF